MDSNAKIMLRQVIKKDIAKEECRIEELKLRESVDRGLIKKHETKLKQLNIAYSRLQKDRLRPRIEKQKEKINELR